jgi:hypothetical protein
VTARTAQALAAWEGALRTAGLSTAERLVAGQLPGFMTPQKAAHVDLAELASFSCVGVGVDVARASLEALTAHGLVHSDAAGRLTLTTPTPGAGDAP